MTRSAVPAVLLAFGLVLPGGAAMADTEGVPAPQVQEDAQAQAPAPSDSELAAFVNSFVRLIGVQHGYMMLMQVEEDPGKLEELKQNAIADMTEAIQQDGLTVERYDAIALAVRDDPALQGKVEAILQQLASAAEEE